MARKPKTTTLTEQTVALISVGGSLETEDVMETEESSETPENAVTTETETTAPEADTATVLTVNTVPTVNTEIVDFLKAELTAYQTKLSDSKVELAQLQLKLDSMSNCHSHFRQIVQDVTGIRTAALGHRPLSLESLSDEVLLQEYTNITTSFHESFPVGGRAILPSTQTPDRPELSTGVSPQAIKASKI